MNSLVLLNNKLSSIDKTIVENKEWPFEGYTQEILNLTKYFGIRQYLGTNESNGVNSIVRVPVAILSIDPNYLDQREKNPLYPHSLFFSNGSAINFNQIMYIGLEDKLKENLIDICPFVTALSKDLSVLKLLNSPDITYRNLLLYAKQIKDSLATQKVILDMAEHARDLGMYD
jgi:hypothetical protein